MARVSVQLLGRPVAWVDGVQAPAPKGAKVWGLLAYLAAADRPHTRSELSELLFGEATDPLGALRWNLAALRRLLDRPDDFKGDAIRLDRSEVAVDTVGVDEADAVAVSAGLGGWELLAQMRFPDSPVFELWLAAERERLRRRVSSLTREGVLVALARGDDDLAIRLANELVVAEPFDEGHHALLIRTLALAGDHEAARRQFRECAGFLRSELQVEPGPAVLAAAHFVMHPVTVPGTPSYDEVCARLNVAWQSLLAGSIDHALDMGRATVAMSDQSGEVVLRVAGRLFLAGMLGMAVRGWDEAATATMTARHLAVDAGLDGHVALAHGVSAGNELMRGDYRAALDHATTGLASSGDAGARALNLSFLCAVECSIGEDDSARGHAAEAVAEAERSADPVHLAYAYAYSAQLELRTGRDDAARALVQRAIDACAPVLVLKAWPMAMAAELEVRAGAIDRAVAMATQADGLATAVGVSYQRALAQRALALAEAAVGDHQAAIERLTAALGLARRTTGQGYAFHWPVAWVLESLASLCARVRPSDAERWAEALHGHQAATSLVATPAGADERRAAGTVAGRSQVQLLAPPPPT